MQKTGRTQALTLIGLLGLGALLSGCTTLTDEAPELSVSAHVTTPPAPMTEADPEWEATQLIDTSSGAVVLEAEAGQELVIHVTGSGDGGGEVETMLPGATRVFWTCLGQGPISIATSDGAQTEADCSDSDAGQVHMSSFINDAQQSFEVIVTADAEVSWQVLVTQPTV